MGPRVQLLLKEGPTSISKEAYGGGPIASWGGSVPVFLRKPLVIFGGRGVGGIRDPLSPPLDQPMNFSTDPDR